MLLIPANHHIPARAKGVAGGALGVARPVPSLWLFPDSGGALADGLGYLLRAASRGSQTHSNHAVHAGEVGKRHMLAQTSVVGPENMITVYNLLTF